MGMWGLLTGFLVVEPCCLKVFISLFSLFLISNLSLARLLSFLGLHGFELLRTLVVDFHDGITLASLRDLNLSKCCVALPRYIVYGYKKDVK